MTKSWKTSYLALSYREPGHYIPAHDPSYTNETLDEAVREAKHDLASGAEVVAIYKLVGVIRRDEQNIEQGA